MARFLTYLHHSSVLTLAELRICVSRRKALVGLALYILVFLLAAYYLVGLQRELSSANAVVRAGLGERELQAVFGSAALNEGAAAVAKLVRYLATQPLGVWCFQFVALLWYPMFVSLMSFDAVAGEVYRGTPRFVVQRASRASYLTSKFLAPLVVYLGLHLLACLVLWGGFLIWLPQAEVAGAIVRYASVMLGFIAVLTAATVFVSSVTSSPGRSLISLHFFWFACCVIAIWWPALNPMRGEWIAALLMPEGSAVLSAILGFWGWAFALFLLSLALWRRREL
jgi:hypothetical protein